MKFIFFILITHALFASPARYQEQFARSLNSIIANSSMSDTYPGMVVASPSRQNPNYYFDWVRDTALTMRSLVDYYEIKKDIKIKQHIFRWIESEKNRQNLATIAGLGEPKFNINGTPFYGPWGRPQNDGPALRAITLIKFARILINEGNSDYVLKNLYHGILPADSVIKKDLEYTAYHWQEPSFDLWEEESGIHFYTLMAQHTALQEGAKLAESLADYGAATFYKNHAKKIAIQLNDFFDEKIGIKATFSKTSALGYKNSGLDIAPLLALIHNYPFQQHIPLDHPKVKKYINSLINTFSTLYSINTNFPQLGVAIGRYPEDRYDGYQTDGQGNPWFLSTLALGEFYCLTNESREKTDKQFARVLFHSGQLGQLSEQYNKNTGYMQGADQLTWSHTAFITSMIRCHFIPL